MFIPANAVYTYIAFAIMYYMGLFCFGFFFPMEQNPLLQVVVFTFPVFNGN